MCRKATVAPGARRDPVPGPVAPTVPLEGGSSGPVGQFGRRPCKALPTAGRRDSVRTRQFSIAVPWPSSLALKYTPRYFFENGDASPLQTIDRHTLCLTP